MACNQFITFNNGLKAPVLGLGTWQASSDEIQTAVRQALDAGYRHIDTAAVYLNEAAIGKVLREYIDSGRVKREELFIVTKLSPAANRPSDVEEALRKSLDKLQLNYVDLYLVHTPFAVYRNGDDFQRGEDGSLNVDKSSDHVAVWKVMEQMVENGLTKSIGVSNFNKLQMERLLKSCRIRPANLQIEHHIYLQQSELLQYCKEQNITVTAYSPLGSKGIVVLHKEVGYERDLPDLLNVPEVQDIAKAHNKTPAQILLRWIIDCGLLVIPKSTNEKRIKENINIFDFHLNEAEIQKLRSLDANVRICDFKFLAGLDKHPEFPF